MKEYSVIKCISLATIFICTGLDCVLRPQLSINSVLVIGALISLWMYYNIYKFGVIRWSCTMVNQFNKRNNGISTNLSIPEDTIIFTWLKK